MCCQSIILSAGVASFITTDSFNKTEAAVFSCRLCFLRAFLFISLNLYYIYRFIISLKQSPKLVPIKDKVNTHTRYVTWSAG